jgi:hypothetical protein
MRSAPLPDFGSLQPADMQRLFDEHGYEGLHRMLSDYQQGVLDSMNGRRQAYDRAIGGVEQMGFWVEATKFGLKSAKVIGATVAGGPPGGITAGGWYVGKWLAGQGIAELPQPGGGALKTVVAGVTLDGGFDPAQATLEAMQQFGTAPALFDLHGASTLAWMEDSAKLRHADSLKRTVTELKVAHQIETGTLPTVTWDRPTEMAEALTGLRFSSSQPWGQMPDLLKEVVAAPATRGPVMLLGEDRVKIFAFERILRNQGLDAVSGPPLSNDQLLRVASTVDLRAVVGFQYDYDDIARKMAVPWWPDDHGGGGGAVAVKPLIPIAVQESTFSFPGADGRSVTLPLPSQYRTPNASWSWARPWTPKGDVSGVRTEELEWVFVDKGTWPVVTFFTLAYEPDPAVVQHKQ